MSIYADVDTIINRTAVELGFSESTDPLTDNNNLFIQLRALLNSTGEELIDMHTWQELIKEHSITTDAAVDDGTYDLPSNFKYMIPQTGWDRTNNYPISNPLSPQQWQYLKGNGLSDNLVYASFRLKARKFTILPDTPVPDALTIYFEYMSDDWLNDFEDDTIYYNEVDAGSDIVLLPKTLVIKLLKCKWLEAKGFDSTKARDDFAVNFLSATGNNASAPILNAGGGRGYPYINMSRNVPDTGYGS